jgi:proteasome component ECM29
MEAVERCIEHVDGDNINALAARLNHLIRKGVGLPTRAACARTIVLLVAKIPFTLREHPDEMDSILKALSGTLKDRSVSISKGFATAAGRLTRFCSTATVEKFGKHLRNIYFERAGTSLELFFVFSSVETEHCLTVAWCLLDMAQHSSETYQNHLSLFIPLAFFVCCWCRY